MKNTWIQNLQNLIWIDQIGEHTDYTFLVLDENMEEKTLKVRNVTSEGDIDTDFIINAAGFIKNDFKQSPKGFYIDYPQYSILNIDSLLLKYKTLLKK